MIIIVLLLSRENLALAGLGRCVVMNWIVAALMLRVAFVKVVGGGCGAQSTKDPAKKKSTHTNKEGYL